MNSFYGEQRHIPQLLRPVVGSDDVFPEAVGSAARILHEPIAMPEVMGSAVLKQRYLEGLAGRVYATTDTPRDHSGNNLEKDL